MSSPATNTPSWSLCLPDNHQSLWSGPLDSAPSIQEVSDFLSPDFSEEVLSVLAAEVVRSAPPKAVSVLLSCLACNYWRSPAKIGEGGAKKPVIELRNLVSLPSANPKTVCGVVFKKGDIVWTCRSCAKDPTCVQCDACFRKSDHKDHEVYFHRASGGGGCCDCGDPEAWAKCGNCTVHNGCGAAEVDPLTAVPAELQRGLRAVLAGVVGVLVSYVTATVRGFENVAVNEYVIAANKKSSAKCEPVQLVARLHNDDLHTFEEVINALRASGTENGAATTLTTAVDREGEAVVYTGTSLQHINRVSRALFDDAHLLFSVTPEKVVALEPQIEAIFAWFLSMGNINDGLRHVISQGLLVEVSRLPEHASAAPSVGAVPPNLIFEEPPEPARTSGDEDVPRQFPYSLQFLREPPARLESDAEAADRFMFPFDYCHRNALAVLVMATPYMNTTVRKAVNDLVIVYQQDSLFKNCFSQILTVLYPAIYTLYGRSIGTTTNAVFSTTVQVYTADSVVTMMSSDGVTMRLLPEGEGWGDTSTKPIFIGEMLISTLLAVLSDCGLTEDRVSDDFVNHHTVRTRRYSHLCRDIEYVTDNCAAALRILSGERDAGMVEDWLELSKLLQGLYKLRRRTTNHLEQEDNSWQDAANLVLELENVSTTFISNALFSAVKQTATVTLSKADTVKMRKHAAEVVLQKAMNTLNSWASSYSSHEGEGNGHGPDNNSLFFNMRRQEVAFLGHQVSFPGIRRFHVSHSNVSVHLPLHRLVGKVLEYSSYGNMDLSGCLSVLHEAEDATVALADFPLRCLAFTAQNAAGMWRRNGNDAANLAFNYDRSPLCKSLRNLDLVAIQAATLALGPESVLALAVERFELTPLLEIGESFLQRDALAEYRGSLLADLLRTVLLIVTYSPVVLIDCSAGDGTDTVTGANAGHIEGAKSALTREIAHLILSGEQAFGQLLRAKYMIGCDGTVSDSMVREVVEELCERRVDEVRDSAMLDLRPHAYNLYDPEYLNLSRKDLQAAADRVRDYRKKSSSQASADTASAAAASGGVAAAASSSVPIPLIHTAAIPVPHPAFGVVRRMLYQPLLFSVLERSIRLAISQDPKTKSKVGASAHTIIARALQIVTLQIHCQTAVAAMDAANDPDEVTPNQMGEQPDGSSGSGLASPSTSQKSLKPHWLNLSGKGLAHNYFSDFFSVVPEPTAADDAASATAAATTDAAGGADLSHSMSVATSSPGTSLLKSVASDKVKDKKYFIGAGRGLLSVLAEVWKQGTVRDDEMHQQGLTWALQQLAGKSEAAKVLLQEKGISFESVKAAQGNKDDLARRRAEAQKRAMTAMGKKAALFASNLKSFAIADSDSDAEGEDDLVVSANATAATATSSKKLSSGTGGGGATTAASSGAAASYSSCTLEDGAPECIFCRERSGEAIGYLTYLQTSTVAQNTLSLCQDCPEMRNMYRVVSLSGSSVFAGPTETSRTVGTLSQGEHVLAVQRVNRYVHIISPYDGWVPLYQPSKSDGVIQTLANVPQASQVPLEVVLSPVTDLQFNRHGGARVHVSTCGHTMHFKCHGNLYATSLSNAFNSRYDGIIGADPRQGELLCPLCKGITNAILPHTPSHLARLSLTPLALVGAQPPPAVTGVGSRLRNILSNVTVKPYSAQGKESLQDIVPVSSLTDYLQELFVPSTAASLDTEIATSMVAMGGPETAAAAAATQALLDLWSTRERLNSDASGMMFAEAVLTHFNLSWRNNESDRMLNSVEKDKDLRLLRSVHSTWTATAYTLLSASSAKRWLGASKTTTTSSGKSDLEDSLITSANVGAGTSSSLKSSSSSEGQQQHGILNAESKDLMLVISLLQILRNVSIWYADNVDSASSLIFSQLSRLLGGRLSGQPAVAADAQVQSPSPTPCPVDDSFRLLDAASCTREQLFVALQSQPLQTVGECAFPSPRHQSLLIKLATSKISSNSIWSSVHATDLWPILRLPVLSQDLHTLAVAAVTSSRDLDSSLEALAVVCLARLAQSLIEPFLTGTAAFNSTTAKSAQSSTQKSGRSVAAMNASLNPRLSVFDPMSDISSDASSTGGHTTAGTLGGNTRKREREEELSEKSNAPTASTVSLSGAGIVDAVGIAAGCVQNLEMLRVRICSAVGIVASLSQEVPYEYIPHGTELLRRIVDSWTPFLEFACSLKIALEISAAVPAKKAAAAAANGSEKAASAKTVDESLNFDSVLGAGVLHLVRMLRQLGLTTSTSTSSSPSSSEDDILTVSGAIRELQSLLDLSGVGILFEAWGHQQRRALMPVSIEDSLPPTLPRTRAPSHGSLHQPSSSSSPNPPPTASASATATATVAVTEEGEGMTPPGRWDRKEDFSCTLSPRLLTSPRTGSSTSTGTSTRPAQQPASSSGGGGVSKSPAAAAGSCSWIAPPSPSTAVSSSGKGGGAGDDMMMSVGSSSQKIPAAATTGSSGSSSGVVASSNQSSPHSIPPISLGSISSPSAASAAATATTAATVGVDVTEGMDLDQSNSDSANSSSNSNSNYFLQESGAGQQLVGDGDGDDDDDDHMEEVSDGGDDDFLEGSDDDAYFSDGDGEDGDDAIGLFPEDHDLQDLAPLAAAATAAPVGGAPAANFMDTLLEQLGFSPDSEIPPDLELLLEQMQMTGQLQMLAGGMDALGGGGGGDTAAGAGGGNRASGRGGGVTGGSGKDWRLIGIDPTNAHIDAHLPDMFAGTGDQLTSLHSHAPLMGSVTGLSPIHGVNGERLSQGYCDLSHMGLGLRHRGGLIKLPEIYTDLYQTTKFPLALGGVGIDDPALCLVCGQILAGGNRLTNSATSNPSTANAGECTLHARQCGTGVGVFFLVAKCSVLLIRGSTACYYPSIYLDSNGEKPDGHGQFRPLFLSAKRMKKLEELYLNHQIAREVVRHRVNNDRTIRQNWY